LREKATSAHGTRPGIADFVPPDGRLLDFVTRYHPAIKQIRLRLESSQVESLLDPGRLLALTRLCVYAAERCEGKFIEMGVYKGGSAAFAARALRAAGFERTFHLCDTFGGMPEGLEWEFHQKFDFADTSLQVVKQRLAGEAPARISMRTDTKAYVMRANLHTREWPRAGFFYSTIMVNRRENSLPTGQAWKGLALDRPWGVDSTDHCGPAC
jgi:hypothetical protein